MNVHYCAVLVANFLEWPMVCVPSVNSGTVAKPVRSTDK